MKMNAKKPKIMLISKYVNLIQVILKNDGVIIKLTDKYTYLGQTIAWNGKCEDDILKIIKLARFNYNCSTHTYGNKTHD